MRNTKTERRMVERARVILLASKGLNGKEIATRMETRTARVSKWLRRFAKERIAGLLYAPRPGRKAAQIKYKRHGTTTLFAALEVATGLVHAGHYRRRADANFWIS
jgi:transposase